MRLARAIAVVPGALLAGCACVPPRCPPCTTGTTGTTSPAPSSASTAGVAPRAAVPSRRAPGAIVDLRTKEAVPFDALADRLAGESVAYVGEAHDQAAHHEFQHRVLEALAARRGGRPLALGMEMFAKPFQGALDAYVAGKIDEATMLERTEWKARWGLGWEMYGPMVRFCRERKIAVVALNAPREVTRAVAKKGLDGLTPEQRAALPPLDLADAGHRAFFRDAMGAGGHGKDAMPDDVLERFYTAQVIWDEVMSSSVTEWLAAAGPHARMLVVAGNGHVADRYGIPRRAARKSGRAYVSVVQETIPADAKDAPPTTRGVELADYVVAWEESAKKAKAVKPETSTGPASKP